MIVPSQLEKHDSATAQASTLADPKESSSHSRTENSSHEDFAIGVNFDSKSPKESPQSNVQYRVITSLSEGEPDIPTVDWGCKSAAIPSSSCLGSGLTSIASDKDEIVPMRRTKQENWSPTISKNSSSRFAGLLIRPSHDESRVDAPPVLTEPPTTHAPAEAALVPEVQLIPGFRNLTLNWSSTQLPNTHNSLPSTSSTDSFRNPFYNGVSNPLTCARLPPPLAHQLSSPLSPMIIDPPDHLSLFGPREYAVIKISNIPWDLTIFDTENFFDRISLPISSQQRVHILMNRATGKTLPDAFVEIRPEDIEEAIKMDRRYLKGRLIGVSLSSQEELLSHIFPRWRGTWNGVNAVLGTGTKATTSELSSRRNHIDLAFLSYEELNQIIAVCRNYKLFFSRKCAQRPFENIISILMKFPWHQKELIVDVQRNLLFELCKVHGCFRLSLTQQMF
ncbi:hypothetical protein BKA69DRAFT_1079518 [Paraphysoderma sedebokerense]|nr:hypothetical protein BKA69DRAFT_1079518 [Paraphysoderma sedebokerense]